MRKALIVLSLFATVVLSGCTVVYAPPYRHPPRVSLEPPQIDTRPPLPPVPPAFQTSPPVNVLRIYW